MSEVGAEEQVNPTSKDVVSQVSINLSAEDQCQNEERTEEVTSFQINDEVLVEERSAGDGRESDSERSTAESDEEEEASSESQDKQNSCIVNAVGPDVNSEEIGNGTIPSSMVVPCILPWGAKKERMQFPPNVNVETDLRPGEFVMHTLFAEFTIMVERKIDTIMQEPLERSLSKSLQRGEDATFDQLLLAFGNVAEQCLPSFLRTLFAWYTRQGVPEWGSNDHKYKQDPNKKSCDSWSASVEREQLGERRDLAVDFLFCLVLIEVLRQLPVHPGHDDLIKYIEDIAFKHFKYREGVQNNPNCANINIIADLYAEVVGVLAQSRFQCVRRRFMADLKDLRSREASVQTTQSITSLLMGMKFFRVKMVPIEEFEASFQFMQECAQYFLEVRDKDIKHALAGLFVEILVPVAAAAKNEVNVPCLKNFVDMLYSTTLDMATKNKHRLNIFPLVTCLLCVSQKMFFLSNWHYFLAMCLQHLKNRDPKMSRVALESLFRLLWVYTIRIKCESNSATQSRLASIVNSLFPKGSKAVVPRDTPLNIFVKIIQFIAQERLDFAMREIIFDLLSVGRKFILTPERMSIGLRAFLVVADNLQQKEGEPPMPRTVAVLPSGNTLRVKKTFLNKMLTEDTARNIGISAYYSLVRKAFNDILKALDSQFGKPLMMSSTQNVNKEPDDMLTGERKPKIDLFRTCVAAIPRLIPDGMSGQELVDLLSRLTVHVDEELKGLAFQSLQNLVIDFPDWRHDVVYGFVQFLIKEVGDTNPQLLDNGLRMLLQILTAWKTALSSGNISSCSKRDPGAAELQHLHLHQKGDLNDVFYFTEAFAFVMLCSCRQAPRRLAIALLREIKGLSKALLQEDTMNDPLIDVLDRTCESVLENLIPRLPPPEKAAVQSTMILDAQWLVDRNSPVWTSGFKDDSLIKSISKQQLSGSEEVWASVLCGFLRKDRVFSSCSQTVTHIWHIVYSRIKELYTIVDPLLPNENRASLLRSATQTKKPVNERDVYLNLWRNYIVVGCRVVPAVTKTPVMRCASPDISLGSSPDSGGGVDKGSDKPVPISPQCLYKLLVPLLRCDVGDMRDTATLALGKINHLALSDMMEELLPYIRESIDRKQENMRRRRRRDAIRVQLVRLFEMCAEEQTFPLCESVIDHDSGSLQKRYLEYIDGARAYLEGETDKDNTLLQIKKSFCNFVRKLIQSFSLEQRLTLMPRNLRRSLFYLFASWSGAFGAPFGYKVGDSSVQQPNEFEYCSLYASTFVLCCGAIFDSELVADDGSIYKWLSILFNSNNEMVRALAEETIVLLLEFNPDSGAILDWVVDQCYVAEPLVADGCFSALATIFSAREYPCDHYTAIMNVTLLNTGCPRANIHETALQLLQILDMRFFGAVSPLVDDSLEDHMESSTLDVLLSATYSRSQLYLSKQLAHLHPELTMPMFSEISYRLQTARSAVRQLLFHCMLPWLYNMELVDPSLPSSAAVDAQFFGEGHQGSGLRREGWGSAEATEMVLNNLFYITVKFGDENPKEIEDLWAAMSTCWPNNLRVIIRYLFIITAMAPQELLSYAKRVTVYVGRARPERLVEELITELGTVETLNCVIERTETPPFFRLTSMRKTSSHGDGGGVTNGPNGGENEGERGGTLHTKRHSGEQQQDTNKDRYSPQVSQEQVSAPGSLRSMASMGSGASSIHHAEAGASQVPSAPSGILKQPSGNAAINNAFLISQEQHTTAEVIGKDDNYCATKAQPNAMDDVDHYEPHPLPMPEYGGFFAPLTEYLPDSSQPITAFHRCNLAVMLLCDVIVAGIDEDCQSIDWSIHIALMLHIITLGMDNSRSLVHQHCKILLVHLLTVVADHRDHLGVARVLLNNKTTQLGYGLTPHNTFVHHKNFTADGPPQESSPSHIPSGTAGKEGVEYTLPPVLDGMIIEEGSITSQDKGEGTSDTSLPEETQPQPEAPLIIASDKTTDTSSSSSAGATEFSTTDDLQFNIKALIDFIIFSKNHSLWIFEDITSKQFTIKSADHICNFVRHIVAIFSQSLPHTHIEERMAQIALHLALSCSSRHYAGRSLQVFRCLRVSMSSRMLSELLGRLVETVAEQGDDMQGYVTELMLTLEASVDALHSDFRPIEFVRELFKSTPNLNKERKGPPNYSVLNQYYPSYPVSTNPLSPHGGHFRSTSYTVSYGRVHPEMRLRCGTDADSHFRPNSLSKSRSAQSLKQLADQSSADDKMTVLAQLFWISVSMLESDYEYEFILAMRLLDKVLSRLSLDRPDCRDKIEKLQQQLKWKGFPGIHDLLLKGCTSPTTYEPTISLLSRLTQMTDVQVIDPTQNRAFPCNVIALLPYMLLNYEDANELCVQAAENIAQECNEMGKQLENLATVMTLYSRRNFSKESFQWTKCVVKYLHDTYSHLTPTLMTLLVEVLEKGPASIQNPVLNILHCMLHYVDMNTTAAQLINGDLLRVTAKYIEGSHWKEALRILKLAVTRSSSLVVPPSSSHSVYWDQHIYTDMEAHFRKELPGRTMEFTFDVTQTPVIGRRYLTRLEGGASASGPKSILISDLFKRDQGVGESSVLERESVSPQRSLSLSAVDTTQLTGWKRPWLSQARVRERLVNLLNTCGQRVGLPKSPSVIFSQSSELERQSSMASSTEEVSVAPGGDMANDKTADDMTSSEKQFAVFKDFDFLEYELESQGEESIDNFNLWGVRRRSPSHGGAEDPTSQQEDPQSESTSSHEKKASKSTTSVGEQEWWEEEGSLSPSDDPSLTNTGTSSEQPDLPSQQLLPSVSASPTSPKLSLITIPIGRRSASPASISDNSESSEEDLGDMTPCNTSPGVGSLLFRPIRQPTDYEDIWRNHLLTIMTPGRPITEPHITCCLFDTVYMDCLSKFCNIVADGSQFLGQSVSGIFSFLKQMEVIGNVSLLPYVYIDSHFLTSVGLIQKFRSTFIALQEHLDTYFDKQDNALVCLDGLKSTLKLHSLGDSMVDLCADDQQIDLCRSLYKLNFQLSLLYETYTKLITMLLQSSQTIKANDHSLELSALRGKLSVALEEINAAPGTPPREFLPTPNVDRQVPEGEECEIESLGEDSEAASIEGESTLGAVGLDISEETHSPVSCESQTSTSSSTPPISNHQAHHQLLQLVADQEWVEGVRFVKRHQSLCPNDVFTSLPLDYITIILNVYCSYLSDKKPGMIAVSNYIVAMEEACKQLSDSNLSALGILRMMEQSAKRAKDTMDANIRKTEC